MKNKKVAIFFAILAAALYAINIPLSKILLNYVGSVTMAGLLYLGAGLGMLGLSTVQKLTGKNYNNKRLTKKDLPYTVGMVVLDIAAPIFLMLGVARTNSSSASLLNNFEIAATSIIALFIFKEAISKRLWICIAMVTAASVLLSFDGLNALEFNSGSLFVIAACVCWGFENNCTRMISNKSAEQIVIIKGVFSGLSSIIISLLLGEHMPEFKWIAATLVLGFVAYGLSIRFYIMAQKYLGAAKTSAFYSVAPFLGVSFSLLLLGEKPRLNFYIALIIMAISTLVMVKDTLSNNSIDEKSLIKKS